MKSDLLAGKPYGHFFGLRGPIPSALVENLFLSNANEAALLRDDATLDALADGCAQGILEYLAVLGPADDRAFLDDRSRSRSPRTTTIASVTMCAPILLLPTRR